MPVQASYTPVLATASLPGAFWDEVEAAEFPIRTQRFANERWASRVGLGDLTEAEWSAHFAGFTPLPENMSRPLALRYHGHQFQSYNPNLGDGRGFLFAQVRDPVDGRLLDLGTKGSGQTPYSRGGDGRLTLKGGVREVLATEMLEALGVYTSKSFSLFETGESLERGDEPSPTRSSVLVRLSHSHIRFGSFERHAFLGDRAALQKLVDFSIEHYMPEIADSDDRGAAMFQKIVESSAELVASWMIAGFVHGVLNTDNMNITGESFDYGPYRFLPTYDKNFVAAYFDHSGLYSFRRQPEAVFWNLERLALALEGVVSRAQLAAALKRYEPALEKAVLSRFLARLGLASRGGDRDADLLNAAYGLLAAHPIGYHQFFFDWFGGMISENRAKRSPDAKFYAGQIFSEFQRLLAEYQPRPGADSRIASHPYFEPDRPAALLIDEIERIWSAIDERDDWTPFEDKISSIRTMGRARSFVDG